MVMNNLELVASINSLRELENKKLPHKLSYAIAKNLMLLETEYSLYEKSLNKLYAAYEPYSDKDDNGNMKRDQSGIPLIDKKHQDEFFKDLSELVSSEIELSIYTIDEAVLDFDDNKYDALSIKEIKFLMSFLVK